MWGFGRKPDGYAQVAASEEEVAAKQAAQVAASPEALTPAKRAGALDDDEVEYDHQDEDLRDEEAIFEGARGETQTQRSKMFLAGIALFVFSLVVFALTSTDGTGTVIKTDQFGHKGEQSPVHKAVQQQAAAAETDDDEYEGLGHVKAYAKKRDEKEAEAQQAKKLEDRQRKYSVFAAEARLGLKSLKGFGGTGLLKKVRKSKKAPAGDDDTSSSSSSGGDSGGSDDDDDDDDSRNSNDGGGDDDDDDDDDDDEVPIDIDEAASAVLTPVLDVPVVEMPPAPRKDVSENGVICMYKRYGRLNNQILSVRGGLLFALILNRTLVVPRTVSSLFDADLLGNIHPQIAVAYDASLCSHAKPNKVLTKTCKHKTGCKLLDPALQDRLRQATYNNKVLGIYGNTMFRNARWAKDAPGINLEIAFYRNLFPRESIRQAADEFIAANFKGKEFAAVHLRWLEGSCLYRMRIYNNNIGKLLCSPKKEVFLEVMQDVINRTDMPIFVASDRQRLGALQSYDDGNGYFYKGPCSGYTCAVIDFEIAARSNFFVGVIVSTASDTVAQMRKYRRLRDTGTQYTSVLSWSRNRTELVGNKGGYYKL